MYKPHRKPWPKSKTSDISKQSPSPLHHTFLLGRARFTAQTLSALVRTEMKALTRICFGPYKGIQDSPAFLIPYRGFRIPAVGFQSLSVELWFWIGIVSGIPDSLSCIPDSTSNFSQIPDSGYWIPVLVSGTLILDCNRYWDFGFLELYSGFQSPWFRIPRAKISWIPESGFPYMSRTVSWCLEPVMKHSPSFLM